MEKITSEPGPGIQKATHWAGQEPQPALPSILQERYTKDQYLSQTAKFTRILPPCGTRNRRIKLSCIVFFGPMRRKEKRGQDQNNPLPDLYSLNPRSNKQIVKVNWTIWRKNCPRVVPGIQEASCLVLYSLGLWEGKKHRGQDQFEPPPPGAAQCAAPSLSKGKEELCENLRISDVG